ncbi:helix-turn-helix domain-containing protein [Haloarculaceae archaeon H-GB2-1]|nr:helix-turn-helix domain-containing protein [Haloarculaceae archaeon H-GB1-1]MEA5386714.1 helix-turn-helix domain-containing protein [Haloarculaceae archaeon H-GB11]MEA5408240.1 helix-turn-helix domain-containing protein [Haloarculaceae archaeon H-GB2-1]
MHFDDASCDRQDTRLTLGTNASGNDVVAVLDDPDCRRLLAALDEPRTADELTSRCSLARSTAYRKLGLLSEVGLLEERHRIRSDGNRVTRYARTVDRFRIGLDGSALSLSFE